MTKPLQEKILPLSSLKALFIQKKKSVLVALSVWVLVALVLTILSPVFYSAEAVLKEFQDGGGLGAVLKQELLSQIIPAAPSYNQAGTLLTSNRMLEPVIAKLGMQVVPSQNIFSKLWARARDGTLTGWNELLGGFSIRDHLLPFFCHQVFYQEENALPLKVQFISQDQFKISTPCGDVVFGQLDQLCLGKNFSLVISAHNGSIPHSSFSLKLIPMEECIQAVKKQLKIQSLKGSQSLAESFRGGQGLLQLRFKHRDRFLAANFLNQLIKSYEQFIKIEQEDYTFSQLEYLKLYQKEVGGQLEKLLNEQASACRIRIGAGGFMTLKEELEFLSKTQAKWKVKSLTNSLALKNLEEREKNGLAPDESLSADLFQDILGLRQFCDTLQLSLQKKTSFPTPLAVQDWETSIEYPSLALGKLRKTQEKMNEIPTPSIDWEKLLKNTSLAVWVPLLDKKGRADSQAFSLFKETLADEIRLLSLENRVLTNKLRLGPVSNSVFENITLEEAQSIYLGYQKTLEQLHLNNLYFDSSEQELLEERAELSTVVASLPASVNARNLQETQELSLMQQDTRNYSPRDRHRIEESLAQRKQSIRSQVAQSKALGQIQFSFIQRQLHALQRLMLDLGHQKLLVLEDHLKRLTDVQRQVLQHEFSHLQKDLDGFAEQLAQLPDKWISEQKFDFWKKLYAKSLEEVSKLIEVKGLSSHIQKAIFKCIDYAQAPVLPDKKNLIFVLIGSLGLGFCFVGGRIVYQWNRGNFPATENALSLFGCRTGKMNDPLPPLLYPYRKHTEQAAVLNFFLGKGPNYSIATAQRLSALGEKVLVIDFAKISFGGCRDQKDLYYFLTGQTSEPVIQNMGPYHFIVSGEGDLEPQELLLSSRFRHLLHSLKSDYNWIFIVTRFSPQDIGNEEIISEADGTIITLRGESLYALQPYCNHVAKERLLFLFSPEPEPPLMPKYSLSELSLELSPYPIETPL